MLGGHTSFCYLIEQIPCHRSHEALKLLCGDWCQWAGCELVCEGSGLSRLIILKFLVSCSVEDCGTCCLSGVARIFFPGGDMGNHRRARGGGAA